MKALSIQQPWAQLIVEGFKDVENRTWPTRERGLILVHAGKRFDMEAYAWLLNIWHKLGVPAGVGDLLDRYRTRAFPMGGIVGTVEIVGCVNDSASPWAARDSWHFTLRNGQALPLRPLRGQLGFFEVET